MKKLLIPVLAIILAMPFILAACNSTPKAPVSKLLDLNKLVVEDMTISQVEALCKTELKDTGILYQVEKIELTTSGNWRISSKEGGFTEGEEGAYQAYFFTPTKTGDDYYAVFFEDGKVIDTAWFTTQSAYLMEKILKGESLTK